LQDWSIRVEVAAAEIDVPLIAPTGNRKIFLRTATWPSRCSIRCMRHENLRLRTFRYTVACIRVAALSQITRSVDASLVNLSGAAAASEGNYNSACHAKSRPDFASKVSTVAEEAAEAVFWLEVFVASDLMSDHVARGLIIEGRELTAIATASAKTARRRKKPGDVET
jgi:four helix bundle protein